VTGFGRKIADTMYARQPFKERTFVSLMIEHDVSDSIFKSEERGDHPTLVAPEAGLKQGC